MARDVSAAADVHTYEPRYSMRRRRGNEPEPGKTQRESSALVISDRTLQLIRRRDAASRPYGPMQLVRMLAVQILPW
jgi:hypothetical protein